VDEHTVYNSAGYEAQQISNYGGNQDASQANVTTSYVYDPDGQLLDTYVPISSASLQTGSIQEHRVYDVIGRLATDIKAYAVPSWMPATTQARTDYTLDLGGRISTVTGPGTGNTGATNRIVTTATYDDLGQPLTVTVDPTGLNATTTTVYDPRGAQHVWTPPTQQLSAGLETSTNFDLAGHVTSVVKDDGAGGLHLTTSTTFDGYGRPTDAIDPRGIDTNTAYDALDRPASVTQNYCPSGASNSNCSGSGVLSDQNVTTSYVYDLAGNRSQVINPRSIVEYTAYDALGRATQVTENCQTVPTPPATSCGTQSSDQNVSSYKSFDQLGEVLTTTDPLSRVNALAYDALGRKVSETDNCVGTGGLCNGGVTSGQNLTTTWQVDAQGEVLKQSSPRQCTASAPCYQGSTGTSLTDGGNLATGYAYDGLLRLASVTEDKSTASGHINAVTIYNYDPSGNKLSRSDGNRQVTSYTVDDLGRVTKVTDANSNVVQTNYSLAGEVVTVVNGRGKTNVYTLDRVGRTVGVSYFKADGTTQLSQSFGYDADGNMTPFSDRDVAQTTVTYDHLNRVSTVTAPSPLGTTTYGYFMDGAVSSVVDATGTTTFTEDHLGLVATMVDPLNSSPNNTTSYSFDAAGRLTGRTEVNGIVTTATYTGMDQLASKTEVAGSTTLASWTGITYDLAQNRTGETLSYYAGNPYPDPQAGAATYQYDSLNQISQATIPNKTAAAYGFDAAHNLTSNAGTTQGYNNNESLQTVGAATTGSDADGNQLKDLAGNSLSWNSINQLEKFSTTETYTYDAIGRLTTVTNGSSVTKFVYRGLSGQVIEELNSSNSVVRSYAWDSMGRQLYAKSGSSVWYEITDPHGDVAALASASALVGTEHFDAWGNLLGSSGTTVPFGFQGAAGSWTDSTSGFVSMGARWYYPKVSGFLSSDPAAGSASPRTPLVGQRWIYAGNSPIDRGDPTGLIFVSGGDQYATETAPAPAPKQQTPRFTCGRFGCVRSTQAPASAPDVWGGLQNGLVWVGQHLPAPLRAAYVEGIRIGMNVDAGWTARITGDISAGINYAGNQITDEAAVLSDLRQGNTPKAGTDASRVVKRGTDAGLALVNGVTQLNPATMIISATTYGAGLVNTWQTKGPQAAIDQASYDYGYNVLGGGTEMAFAIGVGGVFGGEFAAGGDDLSLALDVNLADPNIGTFSSRLDSLGRPAANGQAYTYSPLRTATTPGRMVGARGVDTIDTTTGRTIGWQYETYDTAGNVRRIRPATGDVYYEYDQNGNLVGITPRSSGTKSGI
jgi:RHS repeat-associated protein